MLRKISIIIILTNKISSQVFNIEAAIGRYDISLLYMQTRNC